MTRDCHKLTKNAAFQCPAFQETYSLSLVDFCQSNIFFLNWRHLNLLPTLSIKILETFYILLLLS